MFDAPTQCRWAAIAVRHSLNLVLRAARFKRSLIAVPVLAVTAVVAGCAPEPEVQYGDVGYVSGFFGGLAVDEPTAGLVGRDILTAGGTAADAAVGMSFALSVTYPSAISLGGGGVCLVHDAKLGLTEVIDFVPDAGDNVSGADRPSAVPTLTRGMAALHSRYGRLSWGGLVSPAERLARLGHRVSRAFAVEINRAADALYREPSLRAVFAPEGRLLGEGDRLVQPQLATILGQIRANGAGAFYSGNTARRIVAGVEQAGGTLTFDTLQNYTPEWNVPIIVGFDGKEALFVPPPAAAGPMEAVMWRLLTEDDRFADMAESERAHFLAEVMKRAGADRKTWLARGFSTAVPLETVIDPSRIAGLMQGYSPTRATPGAELDPKRRQLVEVISGTGFVVVDRGGQAVACNLTLYNPFGTGRMAGDTGVLLAAAPGLRGRNPLGLGPAMVINGSDLTFEFAIASGGGPLAPAAVIQIMAETILADRPIEQTVADPRMLAVDAPDTVLVEEGGGDALASELEGLGHPVSRLSWQGRANAVHCPTGLGAERERAICRPVHDPRGHGLSPFSEREN